MGPTGTRNTCSFDKGLCSSRGSNVCICQPLPSSHPPITLRNAISMWRPPNMTTNFFSPYRSLQFHWISFPTAKRGWSRANTGTWPGFRWFTESLMISIACLIIAMDLAWSGKRGNKADIVDAEGDEDRNESGMLPRKQLPPPSVSLDYI